MLASNKAAKNYNSRINSLEANAFSVLTKTNENITN